jgi:hypothetical protein
MKHEDPTLSLTQPLPEGEEKNNPPSSYKREGKITNHVILWLDQRMTQSFYLLSLIFYLLVNH